MKFSVQKHEVKWADLFEIPDHKIYQLAKYYVAMYEDLGMNDTINDKNF